MRRSVQLGASEAIAVLGACAQSPRMALQLRPTCEHCAKALPPASTEAMICSFECTFCRNCVETVILNVCPNCGGGFVPRPIRPRTEWVKNTFLGTRPATKEITHAPVDAAKHAAFAARIRTIPPEQR